MDENDDGEIDYEDLWKSVKSCESMCVYYVYLAIRLSQFKTLELMYSHYVKTIDTLDSLDTPM